MRWATLNEGKATEHAFQTQQAEQLVEKFAVRFFPLWHLLHALWNSVI